LRCQRNDRKVRLVLVSGWQQAVTVLLAVIPGFVYQGTRSRLRGPTPEDREVGVRVLRALAGSGLAALIYVLLLGRGLTDAVSRPVQSLEHPRQAAAVLLLLMFVAPAVTACAIHLFSTWRLYPDVGFCERLALYIPTPTAWDFAAEHASTGFVRVLTTEGRWTGGYAGAESFFTGYPEAKEMFLEQAWTLSGDGVFDEPVPGTAGVWIRCDEAQLVQYLHAQDESDADPPAHTGGNNDSPSDSPTDVKDSTDGR
jgi:hypothetical protein